MIRAILIDDEESALDLLGILLNQIGGFTIAGRFMNPLQALDALEVLKPDVVFLDIQMPGMLGIEAARRIKAALPRIQLVFTTAYSEYALEAFEIHTVDYFLKPFTIERLQETASRLVKLELEVETDAPTDVSMKAARTYVQCFGGFHIHTETGLLPWKTNKVKELCAFLVQQEGKYVDAAAMIESIWPESELKNARTYFYTCISFLRKSFQDYGIPASVNKMGRGYAIDMSGLDSDVSEFSSMADKVLAGDGINESHYERLTSLHAGEYLEDIDSRWVIWRREELQSKYVGTLRTMYAHFERVGNLTLAAECLQRILTLAPDSEKDGRELIQLYINMGKRSEAVKVYRQLDQSVRLNLGLELEEETVRLFNSIAPGRSGERDD
ncbi:Protein-glutamate methylesterase/protein-glutamine glutaminase [Paenibacillus solanacearum]|uniref:Protein-glutamate methylesterase/protein-glutamine glutaminase n=1 Tax=Paenibacillus solanacearum TaxID=2048548 RepID=A0A916NRI8_9BACL|nr:response regulator [Paenibacillus solanacearum]CAG7643166.1 Protein-glutamate methylesterase/protein-glutamine glutaminase [Paenibacillus solanacearum]